MPKSKQAPSALPFGLLKPRLTRAYGTGDQDGACAPGKSLLHELEETIPEEHSPQHCPDSGTEDQGRWFDSVIVSQQGLADEPPHYDPRSHTERHRLLQERLKQPCHKPQQRQEGSRHQVPLTWKHASQGTALLDASCLDGLTVIPRLGLTPISRASNSAHAACKRPLRARSTGWGFGHDKRISVPAPHRRLHLGTPASRLFQNEREPEY